MATLNDYMARYDHEHHHPVNKLLHGVGIPLVIGGIVLCFFDWRWGLAAFAGGWVLLFTGHRIEGNNPAFFQGPVYFLVGPLWIVKELKDLLTGKSRSVSQSN
jgi:hypothetical protein